MSTVYEAEDPGGNRVAFKLLHPSVADSTGRERLAREVQMLLKVTGPYVAEVIDAETEGADAFLVTELIDGPTLEQDVADQGIYAGEDLSVLAEELIDAVRSIHAAGVLHRDLKPSNVMIGEAGPVLIDFGIAQLGDDSRLTAPGSVAQTPGYCDPRVLSGAAPDEQADWWALAAVLAFAATGCPPFGRGSAPAILRRVIDGDVDVAGLDEGVARAFAAALGPKRRIGIEELLAVLRAPESAESVLPAWAWSLPLGAGGQIAEDLQATHVLAAGEREETEVLPGGERQETEVLSASERQMTEVLPRHDGAGQGAGAAEPLAPIFDEDCAPAPWPAAAAGAAAQANVAHTQVYSPAEQQARGQAQYSAPSPLALAAPAASAPGSSLAGRVEQAAIIGYDDAGNPVYAGEVTAPVARWAQIPPPAPWLVFVCGLALAAAGGIWPRVGIALFLLLHLALGTWGRVSGELRTRRLTRGGKYAHDALGATARLPWALLRSLAATCVSGILGAALAAFAAGLAFGPAHLVDVGGVPAPGVLAAALFLGFSATWLMPLSRPAREGARASARALAPSAGYRMFWSLAALAAIAIFALLISSGIGEFTGWDSLASALEAWKWIVDKLRGILIPS